MMERWNKTMENINDYSKKQADMCIDNDRIPKALYADYGVKTVSYTHLTLPTTVCV